MEDLTQGLVQLYQFIVWPYLALFILLSYLVKKNFGELLQKVTKFNWQPVYTVLIIATIVGIPYALLTDVGWVAILITYAIGTSFYEIIIEAIMKIILKKLGK